MSLSARHRFDSIATARRLIGLLFTVYWIYVAIYPFVYASLLQTLNLGGMFWPLWILMFVMAQMLLWDLGGFFASAGYILFFILMHKYDLVVTDLHWVFIGWMLAASMLIRLGVSRDWILELGWALAGVVFFVQGAGKVLLVGPDWESGYVTASFLGSSQPEIFEFLSRNQWLDGFALATSWAILILHLSALPLCLIRRTRILFLIMILAFHGAILFSPLYFISLGMMIFWVFLMDPHHIFTNKERNRTPGVVSGANET